MQSGRPASSSSTTRSVCLEFERYYPLLARLCHTVTTRISASSDPQRPYVPPSYNVLWQSLIFLDQGNDPISLPILFS